MAKMTCGGIDLGGTKIEARLFEGPQAITTELRRIPTPQHSYAAMFDALVEQIQWLQEVSGRSDLPVGIAVPGIIDPDTGKVFTANTPATGHSIRDDLQTHLGRPFSVINDCMAFALSEACGGAGEGYHTVMGLILGTGVGGGLCVDGVLAHRAGGLAVEIGHVGLPASTIARHGLTPRRCGCGRLGCMETAVSGTGLANIAEEILGTRIEGAELVRHGYNEILDIWADIAGECLLTIQLMLAPDCIILGGGLSNMPGVVLRLEQGLQRHALDTMKPTKLLVARHGDSSGTRGAALQASI
jgi:N-acetylglucosamine kinase